MSLPKQHQTQPSNEINLIKPLDCRKQRYNKPGNWGWHYTNNTRVVVMSEWGIGKQKYPFQKRT